LGLYIASAIVGVSIATFESAASTKDADEPGYGFFLALLLAAIPFVGLYLFVIIKAYRGHNWARFSFSLIELLWLLIYALMQVLYLAVSPLVGSLGLLAAALCVCAVVLLFVPSANRWYRLRESLRAAT
jgi:hypothetical protein